jgi:hypothetical protein
MEPPEQRGKGSQPYPIAVGWARFGLASRLVASLIPPQGPPTLILSLPRSGSTWVGAALGLAANALYLREPINHIRQRLGQSSTLQALDQGRPPAQYARLARLAFAGLPAFPRAAVPRPDQWALGQRRRRRVVIKEVNPLACAWFLAQFRPRLILLLRHPAAIALSYRQLGWVSEPWDWLGTSLGAGLLAAHQAISGYPDVRVVFYEALCRDPLTGFGQLFDFAGLAWPESGDDSGDRAAGQSWPSLITPVSLEQAERWKQQLSLRELASFRAAYQAADPPWYRSDEEWRLD